MSKLIVIWGVELADVLGAGLDNVSVRLVHGEAFGEQGVVCR